MGGGNPLSEDSEIDARLNPTRLASHSHCKETQPNSAKPGPTIESDLIQLRCELDNLGEMNSVPMITYIHSKIAALYSGTANPSQLQAGPISFSPRACDPYIMPRPTGGHERSKGSLLHMLRSTYMIRRKQSTPSLKPVEIEHGRRRIREFSIQVISRYLILGSSLRKSYHRHCTVRYQKIMN